MCKKILILMLSCLLILAGCAKEDVPDTTQAPAHTHAPAAEWDRDAEEHWKNCGCGEKVDAAAHSLQNDECTVCGSVIVAEDGMADIYNYSEYGMTRWTSYDGSGTVIVDWKYDYEVMESGNILRRSYENGVLREEAEIGGASENLYRIVSFLDDGSWIVEIYHPSDGAMGLLCFAPDGTLESEECYDDEYIEEWESRAALEVERYAGGETAE